MNSKKILYFGILLGCLCLSIDRFIDVPESLKFFGMGLACAADLFGLYLLRRDKDMRENCPLKKLFHRS